MKYPWRDIAVLASRLSQFMERSVNALWICVLGVFRCLTGTRNLGISLGMGNSVADKAFGYGHPNWAIYQQDDKHASVYVFKIAGEELW